MSIEAFLFEVVLLLALMEYPKAQRLPDEVTAAVVMDLLCGLRK